MDKEDFIELNNESWNSYFDNQISSNELDKELEDNQNEYDKYGY